MVPKLRGQEIIPKREKVQSLYEQYHPQYDIVLRRVYQRVRNLLTRNDINATIKYRLKTFESYFEKLLRLYNDKSDPIIIRDILGFRIICPFLEDIDNVEKLITLDNNKLHRISVNTSPAKLENSLIILLF